MTNDDDTTRAPGDDDPGDAPRTLGERFPFVLRWSAAPPPTSAEVDEIGERCETRNPGAWEQLVTEADRYAAYFTGPYRAALFADRGPLDPSSGPIIPEIMLLAAGLQSWALAGVRGLLHRYLAEDGSAPDDATAVFLQGVMVGGAFAQNLATDQATAKGYRPPGIAARFGSPGQEDPGQEEDPA